MRIANGGLARVFREVETERFRKSMPWASEREIGATVEHLMHMLDGCGHFAANAVVMPGTNTGPGPSQCIWAQGSGQQFPFEQVKENPNVGSYFVDEFVSWNGTVTSKVGTYGNGWKSYEETSGSIKQVNTLGVGSPTATFQGAGAIELATTSHAQDTVALEAGGGNGGSFAMSGNTKPALYFECRLGLNMASIAGLDTFVGLCEKGGAAAAFLIPVTDATLNQKSQIGFWSTTATPTTIKATYGINGTAAVNVVNGSGSGTWPARVSSKTVFTNLGFVYHPNFTNGRLLQYFQDGVLLGWVVDCSIAAFPTKTVLTPTIILQNDNAAGTASALDVDAIRAGQLY